MRLFTRSILMLLLCTLGVLTTQAKTEKVHATFENPSNTNTTWNAETKTFTWSTTYYNQLKNIGLPNGDLTKFKKLVVDCSIKSGDQFRILFYKGGSNLTLYAKDGVNEFVLADTLKTLYPSDYNEYLLACDEICLSGNNAAAPGEAVINDVYLETYDDEGEKVYATFENPSNTNTTWNAETKTFTWSTTYYNQLKNIGLPSGDISKYKKLVVDCNIKSGDQFRILIYKGGSNLTLYAKDGVNEFILADTLKVLYPNDYNEYLLACDEICLSGNNAAAPGEAVINAVYLETYPENESVEIPDIVYEEDPGKPEGEFVDFTEVFSTLQPRIGLGTDGHPIVLGNGDVVVGQRTKDVIADLSAYSKLTIVTSPKMKLVLYMNHEVDAQQNAGDYAEGDAGKYVFMDVQADENGIIEVDLTQFDKQDLNCICLPWDNNNKGTVWYLLLTAKPAVAEDVLPIDIQFGADYNEKSISNYTSTWTATKDGKTWSLVNFNNNQNKWNSVKCGRKNSESVASITSPAIDAVVKNYVISLAGAANVNSAKLAIMNGEQKVGDDIDITEKFVAGEVNVPVEGQKGYSYVLTIDNASASANGSVEITKVTLYGEGQYVEVEPVHIANTAETAYDVAKAIELIEAGEALTDSVFVKGFISKIDSINAEIGFITYWISADGTEEGQQFECYKGLSMEGLALDAIEVGAEVIVKGTLKKYNDIYELNSGNLLVSYKAPFHAPIAEGKYYLYNVAAQGFIVGANNWGTRASIAKTGGIEFEAVLADGKYELKSAPLYAGKHLGFNGYVDNGDLSNWTIAPVEGKEGVFTLSTDGTNVLFWDGGEATTTTVGAMPAAAENAHWKFITAEERLAAFANATAENPVDATFLIQNPNFSRSASSAAWTIVADNKNLAGGANENFCAESFHSLFTLSQVIANAPAGKYKMTAQGFYRQDGSDNDNLPVFYANDKTGTFPVKDGSENSMSDASASFSKGLYTIEPIEFTLFEDGQITIGAKLENNTNLWCIWDNFQLTYVTKDIPADEFEPAYTAALAAAKAAKDNESYAAVTGAEKTALEKAISDYETLAEPTADTYRAAISALTNATTAFTAAKADYEALAAAKAAKAEFNFDAYAYAAAAKKAAAEATLTAEATSAADAKAKIGAIDKAFRQFVESNAMLEGVAGTARNCTDSIANPNAQEAIAEPWAVVKGEGSGGSLGILDGEPLTDGEGNSAYKYFDGGDWGASAWDVALEQTITLPAGKYLLTVAGRASADVDLNLFAGETTTKIAAIGAQGGLFGRGWGDASVEFEMAEAGNIKIGVRGVTEKQYNWMSFTRFRLVKFPAPEEDAPELVAPEGWVNLISNGNLAGDDVSSYVAKEYPATDPSAATIVAMIGKDNSRGILVKSQDKAKEAWDSQFWINLNQTLPAGSKLHVEFDYKADKAGSVSTQSHGNPGGYKHWACIGNVNFKGEWQHFSADVDVAADANDMQSIAFNLNDIAEANNYYFDNFGVWAQIPEKPTEWTDIIVNGNMEGEDNSCFYVTEQGVGGPFLAPFTAGIGKDGSKAVKVQSADGPTNTWDTQFFIRLPYQLPAGTQYKVSFDYKAEAAAKSTTQMHANPGDYIHYIGIGDVNFTTDWQTFEYESVISSDQSKADKLMQTIAFNLAELSSANLYIFDNVKFEISADVAKTLEVNPNPNAQPYPVPEVAHTWNFTKWSEATVANLKAEAAKVTFEDMGEGKTNLISDNGALWSDHEKATQTDPSKYNTTYAASKDNCFWYIGGEAEPKANGEAIAEFAGLEFNTTYGASRALAIAVNYPTTSLGEYNGPAYLWFGGKNQTILTIKNVKAGSQIKMGVESHKPAEARGVQLLIGETVLTDPEGAAVEAPKTYTEQTWAVPAGEGVVDVVVKNTNGCHIYFIDAEIGEAPEPVIPEDPDLIEIEQEQQDQEGGVVTLATVEKDEKTGVTTYTTKDQVCVIFKMKNVDVKDCDYILFKFAEPIPAGLSYAFWTNNKNKALDEGLTEFKYVFAEDAESEIKDNVIPEISLLTIFGDAGKIVKVAGVYKHKVTSTGIETVKVAKKADAIYNLRGQKVNKAEKGLFIINGKKVVK